MVVTKQVLGINYVMATGIVLSALFVPTLDGAISSPPIMIVGGMGLLAALVLATAGYWLDLCHMHGEQTWRVATHAGLGIGVLTLSNLVVLQADGFVPFESPESAILASSIAIGGASGAALGIVREYDRSTTTLTQSTEVLSRALRHNLRNDMTVILGHLDQLDGNESASPSESVQAIRRKIDDVMALSEKAQEIELAVTGKDRHRHPVDATAFVSRRVAAVEHTYEDVTIETNVPDRAWVEGDWMLETAIENVFETAIVNGQSGADLFVTIEHVDPGWTAIKIVDPDNHLPATDFDTLKNGTETPLQHSQGLGLWLVNWIVQSYNGRLDLDRDDDGSNVTLCLRRAVPTRRDR
ncbi:sensor histidine kinase [Halorhabdus salina]|uniref:sensor histidine kinase n=1 Tax=Halorhabdus salina TaxID=2750670 RepID=UPI0015EE75AD|nr:HAMP domain-containing histidine kinase [Halorhabdus salina]